MPIAECRSVPFSAGSKKPRPTAYYPGYNGARLLAPIGDAAADEEARKLVTRAKLLAEAIPARSYATGRNPSGLFSRLGLNEDMNNESTNKYVYRTSWPAERGTDRNWKHGDFREVAYRFVNPLYHKIVELGGLKP